MHLTLFPRYLRRLFSPDGVTPDYWCFFQVGLCRKDIHFNFTGRLYAAKSFHRADYSRFSFYGIPQGNKRRARLRLCLVGLRPHKHGFAYSSGVFVLNMPGLLDEGIIRLLPWLSLAGVHTDKSDSKGQSYFRRKKTRDLGMPDALRFLSSNWDIFDIVTIWIYTL
mgnify:CR=1 FL=1